MMMAVVTGPPNGSVLGARRGNHRADKLPESGHLVGPVREIAVVHPGNRQHPYHIQTDGGADRYGAPPDPDYQETAQMKQQEGDHPKPVHPLWISARELVNPRFVIEPTQEGHQKVLFG
jgi:hypothetical protein